MSSPAETPAAEKALVPAPKGAAAVSVAVGNRGVSIRSLDELVRFARWVQQSGLAPRGFETDAQIIVVVQKGMECGLRPMAALYSFDCIEGVPAWKVKAALGMIRASGKLGAFKRWWEGTPYEDDYKCCVFARRADTQEEMHYEYSVADAKLAKLWGKTSHSGKPSPWILHPKRMLSARTVGFVLHDLFEDELGGWNTSEEEEEIAFRQARNVTPAREALPREVPGPDPIAALLAAGARPQTIDLESSVREVELVQAAQDVETEIENEEFGLADRPLPDDPPEGFARDGDPAGGRSSDESPTASGTAPESASSEPPPADEPPFDPEREPCPECKQAPRELRAMGHGIVDDAECPLSSIMPDMTKPMAKPPEPAPLPSGLVEAIRKRVMQLGLVETAARAARGQLEQLVRAAREAGGKEVVIAQTIMNWKPARPVK